MKFLSISELPETTSITLDLSFERITRKYNKIAINPRLSIKLNFKSLRANKNKRKLNKNGIRDSSENLFLIWLIAKQDMPKISAILVIFDPTIVPIATASAEFITELIATNISGADVPRATIVKPTNKSLMPKFLAILEDASTNLSAPKTRVAMDIIRSEMFSNIFILYRFN